MARLAVPEHTIDIYVKHNMLGSLGFVSLNMEYSSLMPTQYLAQVSRTVLLHLLLALVISEHHFFPVAYF